ncbi:MAG TPA: hypothetical protein GXX35_06475 [Thermoanaerobacterales bacterium]|nr:hypothetical protein [Thermoanaerobacterales bacterium]
MRIAAGDQIRRRIMDMGVVPGTGISWRMWYLREHGPSGLRNQTSLVFCRKI